MHVEPHPRSRVHRVRVVIPGHLREILKKAAFTRTRGLKDRREAERRAPSVIADFYGRIERAQAVYDAGRAGVPVGPTVDHDEGLGLVRRWWGETLIRIGMELREHATPT